MKKEEKVFTSIITSKYEYPQEIANALQDYGVEKVSDLNLYQKLSIVQTANVLVVKGGVNKYDNYNYKKFDDIKRAVNYLLKKLHLTIHPANEAETINIQVASTEGGKAKSIVKYVRTWKLVNADKPEENFVWVEPSMAENKTTDKAYGSSITYSLKYLFNALFLIGDDSLDPDNTEVSKDVGNVGAVKTKQTFQPTATKPKEVDVFVDVRNLLMKKLKAKDVATTNKWKEFREKNNINSLEQISIAQWVEISKWEEMEVN